MPLTDAKIRTLTPRAKQYKVSDFEGLYILVKPNGSKLWRLKYRSSGQERLLAIGAYPTVSLAEARAAKNAARADLANGKDPSLARREAKRIRSIEQSLTFAKVSEAFIEKASLEGKAPSTMIKTRLSGQRGK